LLQNILHVRAVQTKCLSLASSNTSVAVLTSDDSPASDISSRKQEQSVKHPNVPLKLLLLFWQIFLTRSNLKKSWSVKWLGVRENHCSEDRHWKRSSLVLVI